MNIRRIAVFASGSGTNAQNIFEYFAHNEWIVVDSLWSNNEQAFALERAKRFGIETFVFNREQLINTTFVVDELKKRNVDLIVLAGFLWLIPPSLIEAFKIINIHPALLPKYGGKGMYGMKVHETVVENREKESGITIHFVNEKYDEGAIVFQAKCEVSEKDSAEDVANKVHQLEYKYFPVIIEEVLNDIP